MNINEEIKILNDKAKALNNQRQQAMGAKAIAEENYKRAVEAYAEKYGVTLGKGNFESEYARVTQALQESMTRLKRQIEDIESGKYKENVNLSGVEEKVEENRQAEDEMPFDGGVEIGHKGITMGTEVKIAETVQPMTSVSEPTVKTTTKKTKEMTSSVEPIIKPMQVEMPIKVEPTITPIIKPMQVETPTEPSVTPIIKPMQVETATEPSVTPIIKPMDIKIEDDNEEEDEDVPNLTWNNAGVSLADFKGFTL